LGLKVAPVFGRKGGVPKSGGTTVGDREDQKTSTKKKKGPFFVPKKKLASIGCKKRATNKEETSCVIRTWIGEERRKKGK